MTSSQRAQRRSKNQRILRNQRIRWFLLDIIGLVSIVLITSGALFLVGSIL